MNPIVQDDIPQADFFDRFADRFADDFPFSDNAAVAADRVRDDPAPFLRSIDENAAKRRAADAVATWILGRAERI